MILHNVNFKTMLKLFFLSFLISTLSFAQDYEGQYYVIDQLGDKYSEQFIENAIEEADMCGFFYNNSRRKMIFDDGAVLYLKSADENSSIAENCSTLNNHNDENEYWEIANNGHLIRVKQTYGK